ncbi:hypothetical protein [Roseicyclus marinus]|uniref:hypothetical protein n=1 Tax=Roseicyclus marinus TaxID=2161673 RepID=UPI00240F12BC|nr:hypothetical protein [Roseicyclus marinus]MDG3041279.1 hypothetical protein [Roseicyclus marinus]
MTETNNPTPTGTNSTERLRAWLKSDVTVTLPGWALVLGGVVALIVVLVALD